MAFIAGLRPWTGVSRGGGGQALRHRADMALWCVGSARSLRSGCWQNKGNGAPTLLRAVLADRGGHRHRALGSTLALEVAEKEPEGVVPGLLEGQLSGDPSDDVERAASQLEPVKVPCYLKRLLFGHIL